MREAYMIYFENIEVLVGSPFNVEPSNHIFQELGNNTYDYKD